MNAQLKELLERIRTLQDDVEALYRTAREDIDRQKAELAGEFARRQRRYRVGLLRFVARARPLVLLTAPLIYLGWLPFLLMDVFVTLYQRVCFPIYGIARVRRADYLIFDRAQLPYLNLVERFNCFYCSYGNGVAAYTREVAARTEQYWCPIKHARRLRDAHPHYPNFVESGDAQSYRRELDRLRRELARLTPEEPR